jgi:hypothetical protein
MEQLHTVNENIDLGSPDTVIIHVCRNNLRWTGNLNYVTGDVYDLVNTAETKFSTFRVVLSWVLQRQDVSLWHIGAVNSRYEWIQKTLGVTFVDPNSWVDDWDFGRDDLHINWTGATHLDQLYFRVCPISGGRQKMRSEWQCLAVGISSMGTYGEMEMTTIQEHFRSAWKQLKVIRWWQIWQGGRLKMKQRKNV